MYGLPLDTHRLDLPQVRGVGDIVLAAALARWDREEVGRTGDGLRHNPIIEQEKKREDKMSKVLLVFITIWFFAIPAHAEDGVCRAVAGLAENVMVARQAGVKLSVLLQELEAEPTDSTAVIREVIIGAYEKPRFTTEAYVKRAIEEYRNTWHVNCLRAMED